MQATAQYTTPDVAEIDEDSLPVQAVTSRYTLNGRAVDDTTFGTLVREIEEDLLLAGRGSMRRKLDYYQEYAFMLGLYHWSLSGDLSHLRGWAQVTNVDILQNFKGRFPREVPLEFTDEFEADAMLLLERAAVEVRRG